MYDAKIAEFESKQDEIKTKMMLAVFEDVILGQVSESAINQKSGISFEIGEKVKVYEGLKILVESDNCKIEVGDKSDIGSAKIQLGEKNTKVIM